MRRWIAACAGDDLCGIRNRSVEKFLKELRAGRRVDVESWLKAKLADSLREVLTGAVRFDREYRDFKRRYPGVSLCALFGIRQRKKRAVGVVNRMKTEALFDRREQIAGQREQADRSQVSVRKEVKKHGKRSHQARVQLGPRLQHCPHQGSPRCEASRNVDPGAGGSS
ncbi:MAG: hypothetical protein ABIK43_04845 [candidate division WOR-3 bacterium]